MSTTTTTTTPASTEWNFLEKGGGKCAAGLANFYGKSGESIDKICMTCGESPIDMGCTVGIGGGVDFHIDEPLYNITWHNQHWQDKNMDEFIRFMDKGKDETANFGAGQLKDIQKKMECENGIYGYDVDVYTEPDSKGKKLANFQPLCSAVKNNTITTTQVPVVPPAPVPETDEIKYNSDIQIGTESHVVPIINLNTNSNLEKFSEIEVYYIPEDSASSVITIPVVNPDMKVNSANMQYFELPLLDSTKQSVIVSHYTDSNNGLNQVNYKTNSFTAQEIKDMVKKESAILYPYQLAKKTIKLPVEQSLYGDIVTYTNIPAVENGQNVAKKVGIKSDGTIVDVSHRNLYLLLTIVFVILLVLYMRNVNSGRGGSGLFSFLGIFGGDSLYGGKWY